MIFSWSFNLPGDFHQHRRRLNFTKCSTPDFLAWYIEIMSEKFGYRQYCPIAIASEVLNERWTALVLRSFFCGATRFNEVQRSVPRMSPALLSKRLRSLEHNGVIQKIPNKSGPGAQYRLTQSGIELFPILSHMGDWAQKWLQREIVADENIDADFFMWEVRRMAVNSGRQVSQRRVAQFHLEGVPVKNRFYWLVFEPEDIDVCVKDPGYEVDIWIHADIRTLIEIRVGYRSLTSAIEEESLQLDGESAEIAAFPNWFDLSKAVGGDHITDRLGRVSTG
jgi:DNA-binding HxlR family transcriptional regulator